MSALFAGFSEFHFLRPAWLLLLPIILLLWWWLRREQPGAPKRTSKIAPHLARALAVGESKRRRLKPVDTFAPLLALLTLATAGPSWTRIPDPLMAKTTPLVAVMKVSESMTEKDVPPDRLTRAKHKVLDLLATRDGAPTALVAYAGSAHRVVPLSEDQALLRPYLEGLSPEVMPVPGDNAGAALKLAEQILAADNTPGGILFLLDSVNDADASAFNQRDGKNGLGFLVVSTNSTVSGVRDAKVEKVTPDKSDIAALNRYFNSAFRQALARDDTLQWEDRGWWLAWPAALLALLWFRRGWGINRGAVVPTLLVALLCNPLITEKSHAQETPVPAPLLPDDKKSPLLDRLLTPAQQGQWWMNRREYARAAEHFEDTYNKGYALYQAGHFEDAANVLESADQPAAIFTRGMAQAKSGQYDAAVAAFRQVLQLDPQFPGAQNNLDVTEKILAYMKKSHGEEEEELQQDDSEEEQPSEQKDQQEVPQQDRAKKDNPVSADQWMSTLDTSTSEFLKQRFAVEAAGRGDSGGKRGDNGGKR